MAGNENSSALAAVVVTLVLLIAMVLVVMTARGNFIEGSGTGQNIQAEALPEMHVDPPILDA